jgi:hypothetical protein
MKYRILKITEEKVIYVPQRMGFFGWKTLKKRDYWGSDIECETLEDAEKVIEKFIETNNTGLKIETVKEIRKL